MALGLTLSTTLLGMAGLILGLAILTQVVQEGWKYLFSTKTKAYERALVAFLGPWARELMRPGVLPDLEMNGPFQFWRRKPQGRLLPMDQGDLVIALERTAPQWVQRGLQALRLEANLQAGRPGSPSPTFRAFAAEIASAERGSPGFAVASEIGRFLQLWGIDTGLPQPPDDLARESPRIDAVDAQAILTAFREQFLGHITNAERTFGQLDKNFDYTYRRRNTVLTFVTATAITLLFDQPIGTIYQNARSLTPDQAVSLVERMQSVYDSLVTTGKTADSVRALEYDRIRVRALDELQQGAGVKLNVEPCKVPLTGLLGRLPTPLKAIVCRVQTGGANYVVQCLITTLLIAFGAPFWNDLAGALLRIQRGPEKKEQPSPPAPPTVRILPEN